MAGICIPIVSFKRKVDVRRGIRTRLCDLMTTGSAKACGNTVIVTE